MKKANVKYSREPRASGWRFDAGTGCLDAEQLLALGMPSDNPPGTKYLRKETAGRVTLVPRRAGRRTGALRKAGGHVRLQLLVPAETREKLETIAAREHITLSEAVRRAVAGA